MTIAIAAIAIAAWAGLLPSIKEELASPLARVATFAALGCMYGFVAFTLTKLFS